VTQRLAFAAISATAAFVVGVACVISLSALVGQFDHLVGILSAAFVLAVLPAMTAAGIAAWLVSLSKRFERLGALSCAIRVCMAAYSIFFLVAWGVIWTWLQFHEYLPPLERPSTVFRMAGTAMEYTLIAFIIGVVPAIVVEYFVVNFVRRRWQPALSTEVAP
jgi:hypothetical protein